MILKDSVIYLIGEIVAKIFPFLLLPYLSRKLGVNGFGELSYYQTILSLLIIISVKKVLLQGTFIFMESAR